MSVSGVLRYTTPLFWRSSLEKMTLLWILKRTVLLLFITTTLSEKVPYYGLPLGKLKAISNKVDGEVFAVDSNTLFVKGFSYDGQSEDAVVWAGSTDFPDSSGFVLPTEKSLFDPLPAFNSEDILLTIHSEQNVKNFRWLSVWNRNTSKSLGTLILPKSIHPPQSMAIGPLVNTKEGVSTGDILIIDTQTFLVPDFNYDSSGKEVFWWLSNGMKPNEFGLRLQENGNNGPLQSTKSNSVIVTLPKGQFVMDYDTLSIWDIEQGQDLGFVDVPKNLNVPPSARSLGKKEPEMAEFNCEMLNDNLGLEVRWLIAGDDIIFHLVGNIGPSEYMSLGLSKDDTETRFDSADAVVAGIDEEGIGYAIDSFFNSNEKCKNGYGMCADYVHGSADNLDLLQAKKIGNSTVVVFKRRLRADDEVYDQNIYTDGPQAILWAVGPFHADGFADKPTLHSKGNLLLDFGREPFWNCPPPKREKKPSSDQGGKENHIHCPGDHSFRAQIGPASDNSEKKVWYINGLPNPDLTVQRGTTYTFTVEGGLHNQLVHHPFYITSSKEGGMFQNILEAHEALEQTFAGIEDDAFTGTIIPTAEGRLCEWTYSDSNENYVMLPNQDAKPVLNLKCEPGMPGKLLWTPNEETPDAVYYQSFTKRNIGGKIRVVSFCEETDPHRYLETDIRRGKQRPKENERTNFEREIDDREFEKESDDREFEKESDDREFERKSDERELQRETIDRDLERKIDDREMERESDDNEFIHYSNINTERKTSASEYFEKIIPEKEDFKETDEFTFNNTFPENDTYAFSYEILNSLRRSSEEDDRNSNESFGNQTYDHDTMTNSPFLQVTKTEINDAPFPHDESERSDVYVQRRTGVQIINNRNKSSFDSQRFIEDRSKKPEPLSSEVLSVPALPAPKDFKPHFEGGFVPLVVNPMKEKEFTLPKEFTHQSQPRSRPYRPFLYNESVPFHGTFKPGVPDFSGFNISHYSQDDTTIIIAHSQNEAPILSDSNVHATLNRGPPLRSIPLHLLQNHKNQPQRPFQIPQEFGLRHRPQHQAFNDRRKNVFSHIPSNNKPNLPVRNIDGDLDVVPSQRVYVSLQASGDKKPGFNAPNRRLVLPPFNSVFQNQKPGSAIYPQPIQRRPDFYVERESGFNRENPPPRRFIPKGLATNINKYNNPQMSNLPPLKAGGLFGQLNIRQQMPGSNIPSNSNIPLKTDQSMLPQGQIRHAYPLQMPPRERIPQPPVLPSGIPIRPVPQIEPNLRINLPQNGERLALPFPTSVIYGKSPEKQLESIESEEQGSSSEEEPRTLPVLVNAELVEVPNQGLLPEEKLTNSSRMQSVSLNSPTKVFTDNSNIRNTFSPPISYQSSENQENLPVHQVYDFSLSPEDIKELESISVKGTVSQNPNKESESEKPNIRPSQFSPHNLEASKVIVSETFSTSPPIKSDKESDYEKNSEDAKNKDSVLTLLDHTENNTPFGARLKYPQNGTKIPVRLLTEIHKGFSEVHSKPGVQKSNLDHFFATATKSVESPNVEVPVVIKESVSSSTSIHKQSNVPAGNGEAVKVLYYTPPFSSIISDHSNESSNEQPFQADDVKHIPIIADSLEGYIETKYLRKNVLPNNSSSSYPFLLMPPRASENINLPQISENLPSHDNGTDYSILHHIMALIGGPQESKTPK